MKVRWTDIAAANLEGIYRYISQNSPNYARMVVDRITNRSIQISQFPLSGRIVPEMQIDKIREVIEGPYRIIYHIKSGGIDIVAVVHGAQRLPWKNEFQP
jgi:plasmid stabilization system protein ParE